MRLRMLALAAGGLLLAACLGGGDATPPSATPAAPATPSATPSVAATPPPAVAPERTATATPTATTTATPTQTPSPTPTAAPTSTPTPTATATPAATPTGTPTTAPTPTATPTPTAPAEPLTSFGDGEFRVGIDIAPGLYRAVAPSVDCEWSREVVPKNSRAGFGRIPVEGPLSIVEIAASDSSFVSSGCGGWSEALPPAVTPVETFGDGTFLVGSEVAPGRYRATGSTDSCYWLRLDSFGAVLSSERPDDWITTRVMALDDYGDTVVGDRYPIVDIASSDGGFFSDGCGTWSGHLTLAATPLQDFGDGLFLVSSEVTPGRYRAIEPSNSCHWVRLNHFSGELSGWHGWDSFAISRGRRSDVRPVVDIEASDAAFYSSGCGTWSSDLAPIATPGEPFGDGTFIVGIDIAPGRYRAATVTEDCLWFRLYDFGGIYGGYEGFNATARDRLEIVDIAPTDAGFTTRGCGAWSNDLTPIVTPGQPFGDGTYLVSAEIAPGRYRASAPTRSCSWTRLGSFDGDMYYGYDLSDDILGYGDEALAIVDILDTDLGFRSYGCGVWSDSAVQVTEPKRSFGDGTYLVGTEIAPGRYFANAPSEDCRWYRLGDFGGGEGWSGTGIGDGGAWDGPNRIAVVDIAATDAGFASAGCGTWTTSVQPRITPGEPFGDGKFLVGIEIAPGRYRATTPDTCWFRRLSGLGGSYPDQTLGYTYRGAGRRFGLVDIEPSDAGFETQDCGWTADLTPVSDPGQPFGDGAYLVGTEIAPGRYRATSFTGSCHWKRLSKFGGDDGRDSGAIANGTAGGGSAIVDIAASDAGFYSWGCGTWTTDLSPVLAPGQSFTAGVYLVGSDLLPGIYRATPGSQEIRCDWKRLSDFGGSEDEIAARGNLRGSSFIVEIKPKDTGFFTNEFCGTWMPDTGTPERLPGQAFGEGVYYVHSEIAPGRYRAKWFLGRGAGGACAWWRLSGFAGSREETLGWYFGEWGADSAIVDIAATDAGFASTECGTWTTNLAPMISPGDPFGSGAWLVGAEIAPGHYRTSPTSTYSCHWQRVSVFDGSTDAIIEAGKAEPGVVTTVEIAASDAGFVSRGCGAWTPDPP